MKLTHILLVSLYAIAMGLGQLLFKTAAGRFGGSDASWHGRLLDMATNYVFIAAIVFYGVLAVVWVWILGFVPLSRAFPFTFMSVFVAGFGAHFLFGEPMSLNFVLGACIVVFGLFVISLG